MSRSGYTEDVEDPWPLIRWRGQVASAIRGKRGQAFLRELVEALDALPEKKLIAHEFVVYAPSFVPPTLSKHVVPGVCAIGSVGLKRGVDLLAVDPDNYDRIAAIFGIAHQLVQEIEYINDEALCYATPEQRWQKIRDWAVQQLRKNWPINQQKELP
jgi:hypothetical protein